MYFAVLVNIFLPDIKLTLSTRRNKTNLVGLIATGFALKVEPIQKQERT
jgi:hypothetical protein